MLRAFLSHYPENKLADEAGFSLCNAYIELKASKIAAALAERLVAMHPQSTLLDGFHYLAALAYFRAKDYDKALEHAVSTASLGPCRSSRYEIRFGSTQWTLPVTS